MTKPTTKMQIDIGIHCEGWPDEDALERLVQTSVLMAQKIAGLRHDENAELSVVFTNDEEIQELNHQWRQKDKPTNVLSFSAAIEITKGQLEGPLIGDVILALETCQREADLENRKLEDHISHLIIHGVLHLFGFDHENDTEAEEMENIETECLAQLGIADPHA